MPSPRNPKVVGGRSGRWFLAVLLWATGPWTPSGAAPIQWTGAGGNGSWAVGANWLGGNPPTSGVDTLVFSGTTQTSTVNGSPFTTGAGAAITFANDGSPGADAAFTVAGSAITLSGTVSTVAVTVGSITDTVSANVTLGSQRGFSINANHGLAVSGTIGGAGGINKSGVGLLALSAANTFTGPVNVNQGTISVDTIGATTLAGGLGQNATIRLGNAGSSGSITHTGAAESTDKRLQIGNGAAGTADGGATVTANGTGAIAFTSGTFNVADSTATAARTLTLGGTAASGTSTIQGAIVDNSATGSVGVVKNGTGAWKLSGANSFSGQLQVNNGSLVLASVGTTGAASNAGTNGVIRIGNLNSNGELILLGTGESTDKQIQIGGGASSGHAGDATITANGSGPTIFTNASFNVADGTATAPRLLNLGGGPSSGTNVVQGVIVDNSNAGGVVTVVKNGGGTWRLEGANTFSGGVLVNRGTLVITSIGDTGSASALGTAGVIRLGNQAYSGTLDSVGASATTDRQVQIGSGKASTHTGGATILADGSGGLRFTNPLFNVAETAIEAASSRVLVLGGTSSVASVIEGSIGDNVATGAGVGAVSVTKEGTTTWVLSGANTYTGPTRVSAGLLVVDGSIAGAGGVGVLPGAALGGSGSISGLTKVAGALGPGTDGATGVLQLASLSLGSSAVTTFDIDGVVRGSGYDGIDVASAGILDYGGTLSFDFGSMFAAPVTFHLFDHAGAFSGAFSSVVSTGAYSGTWAQAGAGAWRLESGSQTLSFDPTTGNVVIVPEPGAIALVGVGTSMILAKALRRRRRL